MIRIKILPSLMAADQLKLADEIKKLESHCDGFHLDVMDDHFVPNMTFGPETVNSIARTTKKPLFVHLMVDNPDEWVERLNLKPDYTVSVHIESSITIAKLFTSIKKKDWKPSIAVSPDTPLEKIYPFIKEVSNILIMAVNPGFSGQHFIPEVVPKLKKLVRYKKEHRLSLEIAMDGGIDKTNIQQLSRLGVDMFCIGSGIFDETDTVKAIQELYSLARS